MSRKAKYPVEKKVEAAERYIKGEASAAEIAAELGMSANGNKSTELICSIVDVLKPQIYRICYTLGFTLNQQGACHELDMDQLRMPLCMNRILCTAFCGWRLSRPKLRIAISDRVVERSDGKRLFF